jgi:outer membrane receptor protein involved in Fe transport
MRLPVVTTRLALLLGCASSPALVHAQATAPDAPAAATPAPAPGDIIVTAQRRSQSIQTVPIAITALSGSQLSDKGVTNANQLGQIVPNLQINSAMGDTQPNFALRGVSVANEYNPNQVSPIGVYIDDVNMVNRVGQGGGLYDLQRVEVLRGPQGTLFGRNTTGGAINFITNTPTLSGNRGYAEAGYGNFNTFKAQGAIETTMVEDELGFRVAATYEKGDGKFRNIYPGQPDAGSVDSLQVRGTLHIRPGAGPLDIVIKAYASRANGTQQPIKGLAATAAPGFFQINENRIGENRTRQYGTSAKIAYELSPRLSFTSITAIGNGLLDAAFDADGSPLDILDLQQKAKFDQFSEEARFNYEGKAVKAVAGVFYGWDKTIVDNGFDIGSAIAPGVDGGFFQHFRQVRRTYAVFGQTDVNLTPKLVATIGLRYSADRSAYDDGYAYLFMGSFGGTRTPLFTTVPCTTGVGTCPYDANARYGIKGRNNALTGRAALTYTFDSGTCSMPATTVAIAPARSTAAATPIRPGSPTSTRNTSTPMKSAPRAASSIANWPSRLPRSITITRTSSCRTRGPARSRSCSTRPSRKAMASKAKRPIAPLRASRSTPRSAIFTPPTRNSRCPAPTLPATTCPSRRAGPRRAASTGRRSTLPAGR